MPDPTTPPHLPYQAYRSKRHSRGHSSSNPLLANDVTALPFSRPSGTVPPSGKLEKDGIDTYLFPRERPQTLSSPKIVLAPPSPIAPVTNGLPSPPASNHSQESNDSPIDTSVHSGVSRMASPPLSSPTERAASAQYPLPTHKSKASTSSALASSASSPIASSSTLASPEQALSPLAPRKLSRFRHVVPQVKPRTPHPPSPLALGGQELHSRSSSVASLPPPRKVSGTPPTTSVSNQYEPQLPAEAQIPFVVSPVLSERALPPLPPSKHEPPAQKLVIPVAASSPAVSKTSSNSSGKSDQPPAPGHTSSPSRTLTSNQPSAPYRPGFQPKGFYRHLTDDFLAARKLKRNGGDHPGGMNKVEREKLQRRLEKLVDLHFPRNLPSPSKLSINTSGSPMRRPNSVSATHSLRRTSSIFDLDTYKNINLRDAGDLWKTVLKGNLKDDNRPDKRTIEQRITPWEEDSAVSKCPLCLASFHPLTNRKHHCRLCGRIICSLPIKNPQRSATCSLLFIVDSKTRKIEEVGEGVDYGVRKRRNDSIGKADEIDNDEKFLKGVRICRDCRPILLREQYQQERLHVPTFVKLHEAFIALEREIEDALPQFQELVLALSQSDEPTKEAHATRKRLLEAFAQYDALAKRIKQLPCPNGPGSSQDRIQAAILVRANLFLQKNMFPLQSLPTSSLNKGKSSSGTSTPEQGGLPNLVKEPGIDPDSELAQVLQPLLEQEALLESFVEEAVAQRKFEDVKTLKVNLQEIRREIGRLLDGIDVNSKKGKGKARRS